MQIYRGRFTKNEPGRFWLFTAIVIGIIVLAIIGLLWFLYSGHEIVDPVHDTFPHASIIRSYNTFALNEC